MLSLLRRDNAVFVERDHPAPDPAAGEALITPTLCAVAQPDLAVARGDVPFEGVMGSRFVGVVKAINDPDNRHAHLPGARVVADIDIINPASELAKRGLGRHAPDRAVLGMVQRDGCFAQNVAIPLANLAVVPDAVPDEQAVFAVPLADAIHASRIVRLEGKNYVTVLGDNLPALLCALVMTRLNHTVRFLGENPGNLALAERWGIRRRPAHEVGRRADQDVVIACDLAPETLDLALGLVRPRGALILMTDPPPLPGLPIPRGRGVELTPVVLHEIEIHGARTGRVADAVDLLASADLDLTSLLARTVPLAEGVAALRAAAAADTAAAIAIAP